MPPSRLTRTDPVPAAVLAALTTGDTDLVADRHCLDPVDLTAAVDAFTTAGLAALTAMPSTRWTQVGVTFPESAERETAVTVLTGELERLAIRGRHAGWWFMNKPPGWRIRLLDADQTALASMLDQQRAHGVISGWNQSIYEPETAAFGGDAATTTVHDLFCADTRGVLAHLAQESGLGPREASIIVLGSLTRAARLDTFETGDVFAKVAALRPPISDDRETSVLKLAAQIRPLLLAHTDGLERIVADAGGVHLAPWAQAFTTAGTRLADLNATGRLLRGPRSVLAQIVIFHWNRLGLTTSAQAALANAALQALLPGDWPCP